MTGRWLIFGLILTSFTSLYLVAKASQAVLQGEQKNVITGFSLPRRTQKLRNLAIVAWFNSGGVPIAGASRELNFLGVNTTIIGALEVVPNKLEKWFEALQHYDAVLWWQWRHPDPVILQELRSRLPYQIWGIFNWDEPHVSKVAKNLDREQIRLYDLAFVTSASVAEAYRPIPPESVKFLPPPFDPEVHFEDFDPAYVGDVCMPLTNLYDDFDAPPVKRRALFNKLKEAKDIRFHLYGPIFLGKAFAENYKGSINPQIVRKVFSSCKISLNLPGNDGFGAPYVNERTVDILACGGLMLTEKTHLNGFLSDNEAAFFTSLEPERIVEQIRNILRNYDAYLPLRQNGLKFAREHLSPKKWASTIKDGFEEMLRKETSFVGRIEAHRTMMSTLRGLNRVCFQAQPRDQDA